MEYLGTKRIAIAENDPSTLFSNGMIAIFRFRSSKDLPSDDEHLARNKEAKNDDSIHVMLTDGVNTFYKNILSKEVEPVPNEHGIDVLDQLSEILLSDDTDQDMNKIVYKRIEAQLADKTHDSFHTTSVKMTILDTSLNNIIKPLWQGLLINVCQISYAGLPYFIQGALSIPSQRISSSSSGLVFSQVLSDASGVLKNEVGSLRQKKQEIIDDIMHWKGTCDKLMNQWRTEKHELINNFLLIFNDHKARHLETKKELNALKSKQLKEDDMITSSNKMVSRRENEDIPDDEDEHDYAVWDKETVERIAAGPQARNRSNHETNTEHVDPEENNIEVKNLTSKRGFENADGSIEESPSKQRKT